MFDSNSRYAQADTFAVTDRRGRAVQAVSPAPHPGDALLGFHRRLDGQRLDHIAFKYLDDATFFWRLCELADAMSAEALAEARAIPIPAKAR